MIVPISTVRRSAAVMAIAVAALGLAACAPPSLEAGISCAWPIKADKDTLNVAYPDTGATYFVTKYTLLPGQELTLSGTFPVGRYMSLVTYDLSGNVVDHLPDVEIAPDAGSDNPFTDPSASTDPANRRWTVTIDPGASVGGGQNTLATNTVGSVFLRIYVPGDPTDPTGGVALPSMSVRNPDQSVSALPTCSTQGGDLAFLDLINNFGPANDSPPTDPPVFRRPANVASTPYPNPDNTYLAAIVAHQPGRVVVVRGTAPTTPDTRAGESPTAASQLRYWSLCTNEYRKPFPVTDCAFDQEVPVDASGNYTFVVSTPGDRPANAAGADGVSWLDWGETSTNMVLAMRHMLPDPGFIESAFGVAPGQLASEVMGDYTPVAVSCDAAVFEAGGAAACGL